MLKWWYSLCIELEGINKKEKNFQILAASAVFDVAGVAPLVFWQLASWGGPSPAQPPGDPSSRPSQKSKLDSRDERRGVNDSAPVVALQ